MTNNLQTASVKSKSSSKTSDYFSLMKMRLASLVVFSAAMTYIIAVIANDDTILLAELMGVIIGGFLITGASNGLNQISEKDLDALMKRTHQRPLPQNRLSVKEAWWVTLILGVAGVVILSVMLNPLTGALGLVSLVLYAWVYTPMKQKSPWAVFIGAFPGALPPLIGWVAYTGTFTPQALALFAVQFIWQFPHFWAIAWRLDEDYKKAGFIMLPSGGGKNKQSAFQILFYTLFMVPISLIPMMPEFGLGSVITIIAVLLAGLWMVRPALKLYQTLDDQWATKLMFASFGYLPLILIAMLLDQLFIM